MGVSSSAPTAAKGQPPLPPPSFAAPSPPPVLSEAEALVVLKESHREAVQSPSRAHSGAFEAAQRVACESLLRTLPTLAQADGGDADATHAVRSHILAEISAWLSAGYVSAELALVVRDDVVECACRAMDAGSVGKRQFLTGVKAWQAEGLLSDGAFDGVKSRTIAALVARKSGAAALLSGGCWKWNWHAAADAATFALVDRRRESGHAEAALDLLVDEWAKRRATDSARDRETECAFKWRIARAYVEMTEWRSAGRALESQIRRGLKHANEARELCAQAAGIESTTMLEELAATRERILNSFLEDHIRTVRARLRSRQRARSRNPAVTSGMGGGGSQSAEALWQRMDVDGDGTVTMDEIQMLGKALGAKLKKKQLQAMFSTIDKDGSGDIDFDEFSQWWGECLKSGAGPAGVIGELGAKLKEEADGPGDATDHIGHQDANNLDGNNV